MPALKRRGGLDHALAVWPLTVIRGRGGRVASRLVVLIQPSQDSMLPKGLANRVFDYLEGTSSYTTRTIQGIECASVANLTLRNHLPPSAPHPRPMRAPCERRSAVFKLETFLCSSPCCHAVFFIHLGVSAFRIADSH